MGIEAGESRERFFEGLQQVLSRFAGARALVWGDFFLDHYVWGRVDRISPEAPVVVVNVQREDKRLGGAGNVARNLVSLGAEVSVCGILGQDVAGQNAINLLQSEGVATNGILLDPTQATIVKSRVIAHSQQVVRVDYEQLVPLTKSSVEKLSQNVLSAYAHCQGMVISDYGKGAVDRNILSTVSQSYDVARPVLIDPKPNSFKNYGRATIIKPNRIEASQCSGVNIQDRKSAKMAAIELLNLWPGQMVLITLGDEGMVLASRSDKGPITLEVDTVAQDVFDVSGAGDTVSAVFLLSLIAGATPYQACILSNVAAGIVVGEVGTVAVTKEQILSKLEEIEWH